MPAYRFRKSHLAATAALAIALLAGLFATQAGAAAYKARFCAEGPPAQGGDKGPFARSGNETVFELSEACGNFNGLRISHRTGEAGAEGVFGRWLAERPEGVTVTGISYRAQGERSAGYFPQVIGTQPGGAVGIINGDQELDGAFKDFNVSGDVRRFGIQLICQTGGGGCAASPPGQPEAGLKSVDYSLDDPSAPSVAVTGGTLFEGAAQLGKQTIRFDAGDAGSGVRRVIAVVNGEDAASAGAGCNSGGGVAFGFTPCPAAFSELLSVDTAAAPWRVGRNSVKVCAEDFAGTRQCTGASRVLALNGCATNAAAAETMELEWPGKRGVVQSRQGRARSAIARVLGAGRAPVAGGSVCFSRAIPGADNGAERVLEGAALTDAAGHAKVKVRGQSNRWVRATYFADPETVITERIQLKVSPAIRLELRSNKRVEVGDRIRVVAMLRGKWQDGRKVCFFASRPGRDKFACDTTGKGGRARAGFRAKKSGPVRFYAKVPNQRDYPYVRGRSDTKRLRVKG
ncbi:MAG: hypothetical protein ABWY79_02240 [Solirubrobacterales bacterium]